MIIKFVGIVLIVVSGYGFYILTSKAPFKPFSDLVSFIKILPKSFSMILGCFLVVTESDSLDKLGHSKLFLALLIPLFLSYILKSHYLNRFKKQLLFNILCLFAIVYCFVEISTAEWLFS